MNQIAGRAYNYEFKLFMEGIEVPFKSANIVCTPNGVEFNVNVHVSEELFDLKPKTAVQIFFREWYDPQKNWRLMGDGFFSGFTFAEDSTGGRTVGMLCRDFRMDIRKSPAAIAYDGSDPLGTKHLYSINGVRQQIVTKKLSGGKAGEDEVIDAKGVAVRTYDQTGLKDLSHAIAQIAGTAYGKAGEFSSNSAFDAFSFSTDEVQDAKGNKTANGGLFLDAFVRGIWMEAVGGTRVNSFINKRIRADKRFLIPRNYAGFNFWKRANFGLEAGSAMLANSRFSSLEAAIMNVAGMFSCRVYSCNTPSLISLKNQNNLGLEYVMDKTVAEFMRKNSKEFGAPYILNETMLLPPLEFTAPPNCNLFFPPMYNRINWQRDDDGDITRCYFSVIHALTVASGEDWGQAKFQIPNDMFGTTKEKVEKKKKSLPLTLEERYKGVNVYHGSVEYNLAAADAAKSVIQSTASEKGKKEYEKAVKTVEEAENDTKPWSQDPSWAQNDSDNPVIATEKEQEKAAKAKAAADGAQQKTKNKENDIVANAYKRHAMIKYLNMRYAGRVVTIDMAFNPFVMCGFPGAIISAQEEMGTNVTKSLIGTVQQVSHMLQITQTGAEAATTVIMNNVRFEDEPTDLDAEGLPLYCLATDKNKAEVDIKTLEFASDYRIPDAESIGVIDEENPEFDLQERKIDEKGYIYVKDFLSTSKKDLEKGKEERVYVDSSYEPNRIFKFYETVFGHRQHHFMLGTNGNKYFAYDSMHEALVNLRNTRPDLLTDYSACMDYIRRNICSADAFFHGILGLTSIEDSASAGFTSAQSEQLYVNRQSDFIDSLISSKYYGVSSDNYPAVKTKLHMDKAGEFSSIRENTPITAFIKERREAVLAYRESAVKIATGVAFHG